MNNVTILNFSGRNDGNCAAIAKFVSERHANANICVYNINENVEPCGKCNYECLTPGVSCASVNGIRTIMDEAMNSDIIYYIVPNICGYPSANYFIFNERLVGYFNMDRELTAKYKSITKKFIIVSNTESDAFYNAMQQQSAEPMILYLKTSKYGKRSTAGDILESEQAQADLAAFLE